MSIQALSDLQDIRTREVHTKDKEVWHIPYSALNAKLDTKVTLNNTVIQKT